ncbi:T9SS type A sorting domain-containing protein [Flavobacterium psychrotrophum]|uniref:T9SS type A sorting domain-containing protein n=1 Tax=Flavobacterium psychrotrophum TaxID=2294119 RepID=UPI000E32359D|nr:T9SS type A sorting domain-containing protein [Flavobacterium psychrotrophum]
MKKTLLSALLLAAVGASAQTVNSFYTVSTGVTDYYLAESDPAINETPTGADASWTFPGLSNYGNSHTSVLAATTEQSTAYPGTTSVVETTGDFATTQFFLANAVNGQVGVTAATASGMLLNYSTNNLNLGTFPKSFGATATDDTVAGTFSGNLNDTAITGTFSGDATTSVDAYGIITYFSAGMPIVISVTRLKIEQDLNLYLAGIPIPLATLHQVMYSYYNEGLTTGPVFRTLTATVNSATLGVNETQQSIESYYDLTLSSENFTALKISIAPNPVNNVLHFTGNTDITDVIITDAAGRNVLSAKGNDINIAHLNCGVYFVSAQTASGTLTQKVVKQ